MSTQRRGRRFRPSEQQQRALLPRPTRAYSAVDGALGKPVETLGEDSKQLRRVGFVFDLVNIVAAPASGTTTTLIGPGAAQALGPVPVGSRAVVYGIYPYLEGVSGPVTQARIPGAGVTIRWRLLVDNQPTFPYHSITTILNDWSAPLSTHALLDIPPGRTLTVDVNNTDPGAIYQYLGIRLVVRWIPWKAEWR